MGIKYTPASFEAAPDGIRARHKLVGYSAAIRQLDGGQFDDSLAAGLRVVSQIQQGAVYGWFHPTSEQNALIWRWIIATLFVLEQKEANGTVDVANGESSADRAVIAAAAKVAEVDELRREVEALEREVEEIKNNDR